MDQGLGVSLEKQISPKLKITMSVSLDDDMIGLLKYMKDNNISSLKESFIELLKAGTFSLKDMITGDYFDVLGTGDKIDYRIIDSVEKYNLIRRNYMSEQKMSNLNFSEALSFIKSGRKLSRAGWDGAPNRWIALCDPIKQNPAKYTGGIFIKDKNCENLPTSPFIFITFANGEQVPWTATQHDLLAEDWFVKDI
jgi:hypothetical protein